MRKPVRLQRVGEPTARDRVWDAVRRFGTDTHFSPAEIVFLSGQRADTTMTYLSSWCAGGYVCADPAARPIDIPHRELTWYRLVRDVGIDAPRLDAKGKPITYGKGREQMWLAARKWKGAFDWRDIMAVVPTRVAPAEATTYLGLLASAGYLRTQPDTGVRGRPKKFEFVRSLDGPRAPVVRSDKSIVDGNTQQVMLRASR